MNEDKNDIFKMVGAVSTPSTSVSRHPEDQLKQFDTEVSSDSNLLKNNQNEIDVSADEEGRLGGPKFFPPLYIQRYRFVQDVLIQYNAEDVVDLGCSACQIMRQLTEVPSLKRITLVDFDKETLEINKYRIRPAIFHFINRKDRQYPLAVQILHGNATETDKRIMGCDALSMVEFIEHLYQDDLNKVRRVVFCDIRPRVVIVTTPNFEFNQLFPSDGRIFRHYDHKFEWTRSEFQEWCDGICREYGYTVDYSGVGEGPPEMAHLGYCSQTAVFMRVGDQGGKNAEDVPQRYTLIAESTFPYQEKLPLEDMLDAEVSYCVHDILHSLSSVEDSTVIPLSTLMRYKSLSSLCDTDILRNHLKSRGYVFTDNNNIVVEQEQSDNSEEEDVTDDDIVDLEQKFVYAEEEMWDY